MTEILTWQVSTCQWHLKSSTSDGTARTNNDTTTDDICHQNNQLAVRAVDNNWTV